MQKSYKPQAMEYSTAKDLREIYLISNAKAKRGKATLDKYFKTKDDEGLEKILRYHHPIGITNEETWIRDEIDYLLEYFSILGLATIVGYVSIGEISKLNQEIEKYLGNKFVKLYYGTHYPLIFPRILLEATVKGKYFKKSRTGRSSVNAQFQNFHALNQLIENEDVNQFLWFLDGGKNDGYNIDDLKRVLENTTELFRYAHKKGKDALSQSVRGFVAYMGFLEKFERFIKSVKNKDDQAAYWTYHAYWFLKIRTRLKSSIFVFHRGMQKFTEKNNILTGTNKKTALNDIHYSKVKYDKMLEDFLFTKSYEQLFLTRISKWKKTKIILPVYP